MIRLDFNLKNKNLRHKILPFIAGHDLKKCLEKKTISCFPCLNKISHGRNAPMSVMSAIGCNATFIGIRDEGGLIWSTIYVVCVFVSFE